MTSELTERILEVLRAIPPGTVTSYGRVAAIAGNPRAARRVVWVLHSYGKRAKLPWHRVIRSDGRIALPRGGGFELQQALLEDEGIEVDATGRVDLSRYLWNSPPLP